MKVKSRYIVNILGLAGLYIIAAKLGLLLAFGVSQITVVGPLTGLALATLVLYGYDLWPGILLGAFLANLLANEPSGVALGIAIGSTLEAVTGAVLLRRIVHFKPALDRARSVIGLTVLAAVLSTMVSASIGTISLVIGGLLSWGAQPIAWLLWWIGDMASVLLLAPFLFVWHSGWRQVGRKDSAEFAALLIGTMVVAVIIFLGHLKPLGNNPQLQYLIFPFIIWAAFRFKQLGVTAVSIITSIIAVLGTAGGGGPFAGFGTTQQQLVTLFHMIILSTSGLFMAVAVLQREFYEQGLVRQAEGLRVARDKIMLELDTRAGRQEHLIDANERITKILSRLLNETPEKSNRDSGLGRKNPRF